MTAPVRRPAAGRTCPRERTTSRLMVAVALACLLVGCSNASDAPDAATPSSVPSSEQTSPPDVEPAPGRPYTGYPDAIVVLGHSGSTGESSDPGQPGVEVRENSWATGVNPHVNSLYQRIMAVHSPITGHALTLSQGGATVNQVLSQATAAVAEQPRNALVLVQLIDNDLVCPAGREDYTHFETTFKTVLATLDRGLPTSRIFVVTQFGSPETYAAALTPAQRRSLGGTGPCAFLDRRRADRPPRA